MRKETTPSIEPLFPDGTPVDVYDEDGKQVLSGFYFHVCVSHPCFAEDVRPECYKHAVFNVRMTDWHLPDRWVMSEITPPHTIAATEPEERTCRMVEVETGDVADYSDTDEVIFHCMSCHVDRGIFSYDEDGNVYSERPKYCPNCGAKVVSDE